MTDVSGESINWSEKLTGWERIRTTWGNVKWMSITLNRDGKNKEAEFIWRKIILGIFQA